jgi:transcriptional regulator with XRE-family HTH domain
MTHPGSAIRAMREAQGLTLRQLADLSETSFSYLSLVEREKREPTDRWLRDVTDALAKHMLSRGAA